MIFMKLVMQYFKEYFSIVHYHACSTFGSLNQLKG